MSAPRPRRLVLLTAVALLVSGVALGVLALPSRSSTEDHQTARAVRALLSGDAAAADAALPDDFAPTMGYRPVLRNGLLVRSDGSCSSPVPLPAGFASACARHDLGYDLLRYADARGRPLGPWAREGLDAALADGLRRACAHTAGGCRFAAEAATVAVRANSLRQGNGTPGRETAVSVGAVALGGGGLLAVLVLPLPLPTATGRWARLVGVARRLGRRLPAPALLLVPAAAVTASLVPAVLARPAWLQGLWTGLLVGATSPLGRVLACRSRRPARPRDRAAALVLGLTTPVVLAVGQAAAGQPVLDPARSPGPADGWLLAVLVALTVAAALVLVAALLARSLRRVVAALVPERVAGGLVGVLERPRLYALAMVAVAVLPFSGDLLGTTARAALTSDLGARAFERIGLDTAAENVLNQRSARGAVRAYVGLDEAGGPDGRSRLAVRRLAARGGFERGNLVIAFPTGSGWVDPVGVRALERRFAGDVATVAVQSTYLPSWAALMVARRDNEDGARALVVAVANRLAAMPAGERPRLYLLGQSLGVLAATAVPAGSAAAQLVCGATWTGPPGGEVPDLPGSVVVANVDDPVVSWERSLLWRRPAAYPGRVWLPGLSYLATGIDTIGALGAPAGHGHRYGPEQGRLPECGPP
jgi:uncharacterized membrane protein